MNEESDTPIVPEAVQSTPMVSLNDEIAPKTGNTMNVVSNAFQRVGSFIRGKKSKDKLAAESEDDIVAQLVKELENCRRERDRFEIALLTSEEEKKELFTKMDCEIKLKSAMIENLEAKIEYEAKLNAKEIESLKRESDIVSEKLQMCKDEFDRYKNELTTNASPVGQRALKSFNDTYIRAWQGLNGDASWYVDLAPDCGENEHWTITEHSGKVVIRAYVNKFLRAHPDGCVDLAYVALGWEHWTPVKNDDDSWSFKSHHGTWLSASREDGIMCTKPNNESYERFRLESYLE